MVVLDSMFALCVVLRVCSWVGVGCLSNRSGRVSYEKKMFDGFHLQHQSEKYFYLMVKELGFVFNAHSVRRTACKD